MGCTHSPLLGLPLFQGMGRRTEVVGIAPHPALKKLFVDSACLLIISQLDNIVGVVLDYARQATNVHVCILAARHQTTTPQPHNHPQPPLIHTATTATTPHTLPAFLPSHLLTPGRRVEFLPGEPSYGLSILGSVRSFSLSATGQAWASLLNPACLGSVLC